MADTDTPGADVFLASLELGGSTLPLSVHATVGSAQRACEDDRGEQLEWDRELPGPDYAAVGRIPGATDSSRQWYSVCRFVVHP